MGILMKNKLDKSNINYCRNLVLMPLAIEGDYPGLLKEFVKKFKDKDAELVIHPGKLEAVQCDNYSKRYIEYNSIIDIFFNNDRSGRG
jgi:hypothetical protein